MVSIGILPWLWLPGLALPAVARPDASISLTPLSVALTASQAQSFKATVTGDVDRGVKWTLTPAVGTISAGGTYTAPATIAAAQTVILKATSVADPTKSASATISLTPVTVSLTPLSAALTAAQTQQFAAKLGGTSNSAVTWTLSPAVGTISSSGLYTAPGSIAGAQTVTVKATSVADPTKSATATLTLNPPVSVTVAPAGVTLTQSQTQTFSATVTNTGNTAVTWSLSPAVGSITAAGVYTAPATVAAPQTVTVKATSVADPTKSAGTTVTLTPVVTVSLTPSMVSLQPSQIQTLTATVSGTSNTGVTWSMNPPVGSLAAGATTAVYVAPSTAPTTQTVKITATSLADASKTATAVITLPQTVTMSLSPSTASLAPSGTQQFTATVLGTSNAAVTWSINPPSGTISSAGLYTAPSSISTAQTVTVTAQSAAAPAKSVSATISLQPPPATTNSYGPGLNADSLSNLQLGAQYGYAAAHRFRASHTGSLQSIRLYVMAGQAGYSAGTGGTVHVEVQSDDGTPAHLPSGIALASANRAYQLTTAGADNSKFPLITFASMPVLQAGTLYHVVYTNTDPDPADNFVSVNDLYTFSKPEPMQPTVSDAAFAAYFRWANGPGWTSLPGHTPILTRYYSDGFSEGLGYMEIWSGGPQNISGGSMAREMFTVSGQTRSVSGISVRVGRASGADALSVRLEDSSGSLIEQGAIPAQTFPLPPNPDGYPSLNYRWGTFTFLAPHTLQANTTYHLVISAPATSVYQMFPIRKGVEYSFPQSTYFADGYAQYTTASSTWQGWPFYGDPTEGPSVEADVQFYFTTIQ